MSCLSLDPAAAASGCDAGGRGGLTELRLRSSIGQAPRAAAATGDNAMITKFDSLFAGHVDIEDVGYGGVPGSRSTTGATRTSTSPRSSTRPRRWPR
jgi:hypothetical protein